MSLGEEMPLAIKRAMAVRDQYIEMRGMNLPNVIIEPQIALITAEIDAAVAATSGGNVVAMLRAYEAIKDYRP